MKWKTSWSCIPIDFGCSIGNAANIIQKTTFANNINGKKVRVKFSNLYGKMPLFFEKVILSQKETVLLTQNGSEKIIINPGEEFYSDEAEIEIEAGANIEISFYFAEQNEIQCACTSHSAKSWHSEFLESDTLTKTALEMFPLYAKYPDPNTIVAGISGIQIYTSSNIKTLVLFGDSIIHHSHFSDALIEMLYEQMKGKVTIINRGISGNRILHSPAFAGHIPGNGSIYGKSAASRFEDDCFKNLQPDSIIFLEGTNDMIFPEWFGIPQEEITADELINAIESFAQLTHTKKCKFFASTIMPYQEPGTDACPKGEKIRKDFNTFLFKSNKFDGILDFANLLANEQSKANLRKDIHIGDWIHPNDTGGAIMAEYLMSFSII